MQTSNTNSTSVTQLIKICTHSKAQIRAGTLVVHNANVHQALAMKPHGIVLECPTGCHGDRHAGIYSLLSLASCPISCCPVWGWGWTVKAFVVCILGLFSPHCWGLCCESHLLVYGDWPGRRCTGLLGSLQGPSGQVCSPIKHQKQLDINPPWGPLVWSRCVADMPLLCRSKNMKVHQWTLNQTQNLHTVGQPRWNYFWYVTIIFFKHDAYNYSHMWVLAQQRAKINKQVWTGIIWTIPGDVKKSQL